MQVFVNTYGTSIRIKDGLISIKSGDQVQKLAIGKVRSIYLARGIRVSTDVLYACLEHGVDLMVTERNGHPVGRLWNNRFGSISTIRRNQIDFSKGRESLKWVMSNLQEKMHNQILVLECFRGMEEPHEQAITDAVQRINELIELISEQEAGSLDEAGPRLRALEGQAARTYLRTINRHLPHRYQFETRTKRPARDMFNAMLNYAYGILYGEVEGALIKAGLDPFLGVFHRDEYRRPVLTYDFVEPFRPWGDWVVIHLCLNEVVTADMFHVEQGAFWLESDVKRLLVQHFVDFFEEVVPYNGNRQSRYAHIREAARNFASLVKSGEK